MTGVVFVSNDDAQYAAKALASRLKIDVECINDKLPDRIQQWHSILLIASYHHLESATHDYLKSLRNRLNKPLNIGIITGLSTDKISAICNNIRRTRLQTRTRPWILSSSKILARLNDTKRAYKIGLE